MQNKDTAMLGTSGYERVEHDLYETPPWCTEVLLRHVVFKKDILEPAAGRGAIAKVLEANGYRTTCNDIVDRGLSDCRIVDFLTTKCTPAACDIVTNPPYNLAEEFVRHALRITKRGEKVAMLLRNEWDCAFNRADLFTDEPFKLKIVLNRRPLWVAGSTGSPRHNYAWYVWDHNWYDPAEIRYDR
jgi:hypothetical protein